MGVDFNGIGGSGTNQNCVGVGDIWTTLNYTAQDLNLTSDDGCVALATIETGPDHFKIQISSSTIHVYGESYNGPVRCSAGAAWGANGNPALPFTEGSRGLRLSTTTPTSSSTSLTATAVSTTRRSTPSSGDTSASTGRSYLETPPTTCRIIPLPVQPRRVRVRLA